MANKTITNGLLLLSLAGWNWTSAVAQEDAGGAMTDEQPASQQATEQAAPEPAETQPLATETEAEEAELGDDDDLMEEAAQTGGATFSAPDEEGFVLDRFEARQTYQDYLRNNQLDQAVDVAAVALELTEEELGPWDMELVPILNELGSSLVRLGRPAEAVPHFRRSVLIIENGEGIFAEELVSPLYGLGVAQQNLGEHEEAVGTLQRAQHVTHRSDGVVNLDQIPIIQAIAVSQMAQDKWTEAENLQLLTYKIHRKNFGKESLDTLPAMWELARWYHDIQDYRQARIIYRRTLEMLEEEGEEESPRALPALRGLSSAYLSEHNENIDKGLAAHLRAVSIIENHPGAVTPEDRIVAQLELGDWYVQLNDAQKAWQHYRTGWELAENYQGGQRDWNAYFDRPHLIYPGADLSMDLVGYGMVGKEIYYDFRFTIARSGKPEEIEVIGSNLHGQTRSAAIQAFRYARFRPRIVDGITVATPGYKVRRVYPTDPPDDYGSVNVGGG